jgi:hypothetical protein
VERSGISQDYELEGIIAVNDENILGIITDEYIIRLAICRSMQNCIIISKYNLMNGDYGNNPHYCA